MSLKYLLLIFPVLFTASAQVLLKIAGSYQYLTARWLAFIAGSVITYFVAFVVYSITLRVFPVSVASPTITVAAMVIITTTGLLLGESVTPRQLTGLVLGIVAILLIALPAGNTG